MTDFEKGLEAAARYVEAPCVESVKSAIASAIRRLRPPAQPPGSESREASALLPLRELCEEARAWCGRHVPGCKAKPDPAFGAAYVDAPDCTCYVRPLYLFERNGNIPDAPDARPSPSSEKQGDKK